MAAARTASVGQLIAPTATQRQFYAVEFWDPVGGTWARHHRLHNIAFGPLGLEDLEKLKDEGGDVFSMNGAICVTDYEFLTLKQAEQDADSMTGSPLYRILLVTEEVAVGQGFAHG